MTQEEYILLLTLLFVEYLICSKHHTNKTVQGGGGGGGDSRLRPTTWDYNIFINLTYEWVVPPTDITSLFSENTIWTTVKPLIQTSDNSQNDIRDVTRDKSPLLYSNSTEWRQITIAVTTEYKTKLTNYVKGESFKNTSKTKLNTAAASYGLQFVDIWVTTKDITTHTGSIIAGSLSGGILCCLCICCVWCKCSSSCHSPTMTFEKSLDPDEWVKNHGISGKTHEGESNPFISGMYSGHYYQYGKTHAMQSFRLIFDGRYCGIQGNGRDTVGDYNIDGRYCTRTARMYLNKKYVHGTGNRSENLGHTVKIRLEWNNEKQQFEGPWHVKTHKYEGSGKWVITPCDRAGRSTTTLRPIDKCNESNRLRDDEDVDIERQEMTELLESA
eukprot:572009_1